MAQQRGSRFKTDEGASASQRQPSSSLRGGAQSRRPVERSGGSRRGGRGPKRKGNVVTLIVSIVLVIVAFIGVFYAGKHFLPKLMGDKGQVLVENTTVEIPEGSGSAAIAKLLQEKHVIKSSEEFLALVAKTGDDKKLKPGTYTFKAGSDLSEVIAELVTGSAESGLKLTIPEGYTVAQTAQLVEKSLGIKASDFMEQAKASNFVGEFPFLEGAYKDSLEGYLYPKTYRFDEGVSAKDVIHRLLAQFAKETKGLDFSKVKETYGLNMQQVITMASLIERETRVESERPRIASVIYNRLKKDMPLQVDASIIYALGKVKERLTRDDLKVDSPYNTYTNKGLPPGPICSPSLSAIKAVVNPEQTKYLYYVLTSKDGSHTFTEDYDSFLKAKEVYKKEFGVK